MSKRFEFEKSSGNGFSIGINSGYEEHHPFAYMRAFGYWLSMRLPKWVLHPHRTKVVAESWDAATVARMGRNWYWDEDHRAFGISLSDNHLSILYGRQAGDSTGDRQWGCFLPWNEWRFVAYRFYDARGGLVYITDEKLPRTEAHAADDKAREAAPVVRFEFKDFDGEQIEVSTRMEQREWLRGTGRFKWLSAFFARRTRRSLDLYFSKEVGPKKGSWKGGTIGHSIDMLPNELHEAAFRRYCAQQCLAFIGPAKEST